MLSPIFINVDSDLDVAVSALEELKQVTTCEAASEPLGRFWKKYENLAEEARLKLQLEVSRNQKLRQLIEI
ncbi:MAG: hypothetical protein Q8Q05_02785 [bacterium]|nr:hypothetical protein [bacterium]